MADYKDIEDKLKAEIFKRMVAGKKKDTSDDDEDQPTRIKISGGPSGSAKDMRDFLRDPFGSKDWAKSKQMKPTGPKPKRGPTMVFEIAGMDDKQIERAYQSGEFAGFKD